MKTAVITKFGGSDVIETIDADKPEVKYDEVLIQVKATSVNPVDLKMRRGDIPDLVPAFPATLHADCAGVVEAVGGDVTRFKPGDEVYSYGSGFIGIPGSTAEYTSVKESFCAAKPKNLSFEESGTLPLVGITAWMGLVDYAKIGPGSTVLIIGGTGGVGHVAVQLAKHFGATTYAVCGSDEKCKLAESLGAEKAFNYKTDSPEQMLEAAGLPGGFDVVYNTVGKPANDIAIGAVRQDGSVIDINGDVGEWDGRYFLKAVAFKSVFIISPILGMSEADKVQQILTELSKLYESGAIKPLIDPKHFTTKELAAAHDYLENGKPTGKVSVTVSF